jgi:hypothetical protein
MKSNFEFSELVISYKRETLSAKVCKLDNLQYNRYSVFFNQDISDIGPSHMLISKRVTSAAYSWVCEDKSIVLDEDLARSVGMEIDRLISEKQIH